MARAPKQTKQEPLEVVLWKTADKLRKNIDAAEYKHVVLGLIFLKYISDTFEAHYNLLVSGEGEFDGADPEDRDEYTAYNVFFVPENARWSYLLNQANFLFNDTATTEIYTLTLHDALPICSSENSVRAGDQLRRANVGRRRVVIRGPTSGEAEPTGGDILSGSSSPARAVFAGGKR